MASSSESYITSLPDEILLRVFQYCIPRPNIAERSVISNAQWRALKRKHLSVLCVCRRFYRILAPSIFRDVFIGPSEEPEIYVEEQENVNTVCKESLLKTLQKKDGEAAGKLRVDELQIVLDISDDLTSQKEFLERLFGCVGEKIDTLSISVKALREIDLEDEGEQEGQDQAQGENELLFFCIPDLPNLSTLYVFTDDTEYSVQLQESQRLHSTKLPLKDLDEKFIFPLFIPSLERLQALHCQCNTAACYDTLKTQLSVASSLTTLEESIPSGLWGKFVDLLGHLKSAPLRHLSISVRSAADIPLPYIPTLETLKVRELEYSVMPTFWNSWRTEPSKVYDFVRLEQMSLGPKMQVKQLELIGMQSEKLSSSFIDCFFPYQHLQTLSLVHSFSVFDPPEYLEILTSLIPVSHRISINYRIKIFHSLLLYKDPRSLLLGIQSTIKDIFNLLMNFLQVSLHIPLSVLIPEDYLGFLKNQDCSVKSIEFGFDDIGRMGQEGLKNKLPVFKEYLVKYLKDERYLPNLEVVRFAWTDTQKKKGMPEKVQVEMIRKELEHRNVIVYV